VSEFIPFDDFGGDGPLLHFAHANGYPPASYKQLFTTLADEFQVIAMRQRPLWPGSRPEDVSDVQALADDMILFFEQQQLEGMLGVGHSMGAIVTLLAALRRPQLFKALVIMEPVFLMPSVLQLVNLQGPALLEDLPIIKIARTRRQRWASREEAFQHFRPKRVFARWSDEALWDYVWHGLHRNQAGEVEMTFSSEWEAHIYTLMLIDVWQRLPHVTHPTLAIRAEESDTLAPAAWEMWRFYQSAATFIEVPDATHLLPMEKPLLVADMIRQFHGRIASMNTGMGEQDNV
jgi:pimeloyl-ACP methyl ester carboxylesterase